MRAELVGGVRSRRHELEEAIVARIRETAPSPADELDAEYLTGLRAAVAAAVAYGLAGIELGEAPATVPTDALAQARRAPHVGVGLDTVLRRYVLGSNLLDDYLMQEATRDGLPDRGVVLREALSIKGAVLERMLAAVTCEYERELERLRRSPEQRRVERVQRLLAGAAPGDADELGYELRSWHVGVLAAGAGTGESLREAAVALDARLLCVQRGEQATWAWLGAREPLAAAEAERMLARAVPADATLALGEPAEGVEGWRLTHRQAQAALRVALHGGKRVTRYADVALLASVLGDATLSGSLVEIYLAPLGSDRNGGAVLRQTLRAYFAAERNASSAASALGVARHTVENRLRTIEERLGHSLRTRQAELDVALRLDELGDVAPGAQQPREAASVALAS